MNFNSYYLIAINLTIFYKLFTLEVIVVSYHSYYDRKAHRANRALALASSKEEEWAAIHRQAEALRLYNVNGRSRR